jgi:hypothetical protein
MMMIHLPHSGGVGLGSGDAAAEVAAGGGRKT